MVHNFSAGTVTARSGSTGSQAENRTRDKLTGGDHVAYHDSRSQESVQLGDVRCTAEVSSDLALLPLALLACAVPTAAR